MADNNSNMVRPVEGLQNIVGLKPAKRRQQRKRRQNQHEYNAPTDQNQSEQTDEQAAGGKTDNKENVDDSDGIRIDYRA